MGVRVTTASVPEEERAAYWGGAVSRALVPVEVVPRVGQPFDGRLEAHRLGYVRISTLEADPARVSRTAALIARAPQAEPQVGVAVQVLGRAVLEQDGRRAEVPPGGLVLYDTARPYRVDFPERFRTHLFHLPRRLLGVPERELRQAAGTAVGPAQGCGPVLLPFLGTLAASAHEYPAPVGDRLAGSVADLVSTLVAQLTAAHPDDGPGAPNDHLVRRVREHIDRHLGEPELSPETIAQAHHISVRYLHRLFEGEGVTVGRLVQQRRLEACARELGRRGRTAPTVSAVAQRWGFVNPAHFSRVFRAAYGVSPREWRELRTADAG
ncbi:helix-turn-helix domain-containing protein [Saccharothrix sp. ST-888]|uniref:AraC-like ligand-binding domain-containing protein n=1 Tax=Saccharothrix sp. ST-888 TaxID=1427391 RepID=UPI0005EC2231|nr:helix-turn-helix domain-containing protein [Saccharothrix sp. ST-888]KJK59109.1 transcriptional regulator [Saccharothrix sp. ST-888]